MALVKCKECGHDISDTLRICPHCGIRIENNNVNVNSVNTNITNQKKKSNKKGIEIVVTILSIILLLLYTTTVISRICMDFRIFTYTGTLTEYIDSFKDTSIFIIIYYLTYNILPCIVFWLLFIYYKTKNKIFKILSILPLGLYIVIHLVSYFDSTIVNSSIEIGNIKYILNSIMYALVDITNRCAPLILTYILVNKKD